MSKTYKAFSAILCYPQDEIKSGIPEIRDALAAEALLSGSGLAQIDALLSEIETSDLIELQERYVDLFDRSRRLSLHLFEHVHGDSRDRGQALLDLAALYERAGLMVDANELPDYLPLFLEYLSVLPADEARRTLADTAHILEALEEVLLARQSAYGGAFSALLSLTGRPGAVAADAPLDEVASEDLDAGWADEAVTFGAPQQPDGCSSERLVRKIRAGRRDVRFNA